MTKEKLRWFLGGILKSTGLSEPTRRVYFSMARHFVRKLPSDSIDAAWIRRSTANGDFYPLVSDIDLTILVNDQNLQGIRKKDLRRSGLMQDVQFIGRRFFQSWLETGGYRNYQIPQWKQIYGIPTELHAPSSSNEELAFEIAYEVHLLFKQLALKLSRVESGEIKNNQDMKKLSVELERLRLFWVTRDKKWISCPREEITFNGSLPEVYQLLESLCESLIENLEPPLNVYDWTRAVKSEDAWGFETVIAYKGTPIFVLKEPHKIFTAVKNKKGHFIVPASYLRMMKGIGIQEQTQVNRLASENSYYRKFSCQRLANDLIGAIVLEPEYIEQLYFCFYNIAHFHHSLTGKYPSSWQQIESTWDSSKSLPWKNEDVERACVTYLDHLAALV